MWRIIFIDQIGNDSTGACSFHRISSTLNEAAGCRMNDEIVLLPLNRQWSSGASAHIVTTRHISSDPTASGAVKNTNSNELGAPVCVMHSLETVLNEPVGQMECKPI